MPANYAALLSRSASQVKRAGIVADGSPGANCLVCAGAGPAPIRPTKTAGTLQIIVVRQPGGLGQSPESCRDRPLLYACLSLAQSKNPEVSSEPPACDPTTYPCYPTS